jgi:hypothetical protein
MLNRPPHRNLATMPELTPVPIYCYIATPLQPDSPPLCMDRQYHFSGSRYTSDICEPIVNYERT